MHTGVKVLPSESVRRPRHSSHRNEAPLQNDSDCALQSFRASLSVDSLSNASCGSPREPEEKRGRLVTVALLTVINEAPFEGISSASDETESAERRDGLRRDLRPARNRPCRLPEKLINRLPRGKVLGGSSSINHVIYARGNRKDFDKWVSEYGAEGWSYDEVLPDFISIETSYLGIDNGYHGQSGEVPITFPSSHTKASDLFLQAGRELGYNNDDYNGPNQTSFSRVQNNIKNGERWSSSKSFITNDVRRRKNFDVALYSHVTKVLFEGTTAVGVEFKRYLGTDTVRAKKEVILCAGAIASPQLLMLSGIGPREHLESLGIDVIADLPVGKQLFDHVTVNGIAATTAENIEINTIYRPQCLSILCLESKSSDLVGERTSPVLSRNSSVTPRASCRARSTAASDSPRHQMVMSSA
ncbi:oxygen-dependent choline dehydrogenase-like [Dermacentor silvarum]|uniref:oxygen-dependent choline dehydrogenase-like n=1 Tax=Dermacentor silvarum TaxID=543639 RepID=UPI002101CD76|nr:oxygen-dependent choline dehydrogenase-like [Dermacentor silvarum]